MTTETYYTPETHKRMVKILTMKLNDIKDSPSQSRNIAELTHKIEWHTEQYILKTGELPTW